MKIKRIEHIAIACKNMQVLRDIFENKLGIAMEYEEHLPEHATSLQMYPIGETYLELLQSDMPDTGTNAKPTLDNNPVVKAVERLAKGGVN